MTQRSLDYCSSDRLPPPGTSPSTPTTDSARAHAVTYELGIARQLAVRSDTYRDFAGAEALAGDLKPNLGRDHTLARASARDLEVTLCRIATLDRTHAHSRSLDSA